MSEIGVFTPEQARLLWQDYQTRKQLPPQVSQSYPQRRPIDHVSPHRVPIKNTSAETMPAYGCGRITGTVTEAGRTTLMVEKPTSTDGEFVFNSQFEIAAGEVGWGYRFGIVVMLGDGVTPSAANVEYSPIVGSWDITEASGPFVVFGEDIDTTDGLIGRFTGGGGGTHEIWFEIISVYCPSETETILTVNPTWYTGGCTAAIPGADSYGYVEVYDVCSTLDYYTAIWLDGSVDGITKHGRATYMYPRTGTCTPRWLVDQICESPECA